MPGRVHISGCTRGYLKDGQFTLENGDPRMADNNNGYPRPLEEWLRLFERTPGKESANLRSRYEQIFGKDAPRTEFYYFEEKKPVVPKKPELNRYQSNRTR